MSINCSWEGNHRHRFSLRPVQLNRVISRHVPHGISRCDGIGQGCPTFLTGRPSVETSNYSRGPDRDVESVERGGNGEAVSLSLAD